MRPNVRPYPARVLRRALALAFVVTLLLAIPAGAHPFVRGGEVPVDSLAEITLAMAHGCGSEASGQGEPTTDVSLEVPDWLRIVGVPAEDGWEVLFEAADDVDDAAGDGLLDDPDDPRLGVVTWTAVDAAETAPDFHLEVVATGGVGEERYLRVFQACDEDGYRWVGTPEEPADEPAIRITLVAADPDAPPPPEPEPELEPEVEQPGTDVGEGAAPAPDRDDAPDAAAPDPEDPSTAEQGAGDEAGDGADGAVVSPEATTNETDLASDEGGAGWLLPVGLLVVAAAAAMFAMRRRRDAP